MSVNLQHVRKEGDSLRPLIVELAYSDGAPVDLAGAVGKFIMRAKGATVPLIDTSTGVELDNVTKTAKYNFTGSEPAGNYVAEFEITKNGKVDTFPSNAYIDVIVLPDLG